MKKTITTSGCKATARVSYLYSELAGIYPITPSSPMAEYIDEWSKDGKLNAFNDTVKVVEMQSEAGAIGLVHGALQNGVLSSTYTASQGLLLMIPDMYKIAGEMLPCVMHVAARSLSTHALSIMGDHQDVYAASKTGFCMLASSSVQDTAYMSAVAHLSAIKASLPFMHFMDGFRTSHEVNKIEILDDEDYISLIDKEALNNFRNKALINGAKSRGLAESDDIYFQTTEARNIYYEKTIDIVEDYMNKINELANTDYKPFNYYGSDSAKKVIVAMGSVCETIKEVIDNSSDELGLVEVHLYRPFSTKHLINVIPSTVDSIAVLDRTREFGSTGEPLYLDVVTALRNKNINIVGGRYGLSSKDTTPAQINAVYKMLDNPKDNFTIGINDDITHLSLKDEPIEIKNDMKELLVYGIGSDGMVTTSKEFIKLIGRNTDNYVQGYFEYDSKKSGGVTKSHLRISNNKIRSTYYVKTPDVLVISKDTYFDSFNLVDNLKDNSIIIINSERNEEELNKLFTTDFKNLVKKTNSKIYVINANKIAREVGLMDKISMIMEYAIFLITKLLDPKLVKEQLVNYINIKFMKKGDSVIESNIHALELVENSIEEINILDGDKNLQIGRNVIDMMYARMGYNIPTSSFKDRADGTFPKGTSSLDKGFNFNIVPKYIKENCSNCNMCSFVCPHGVIRPFLLTEEEYNNSPDYVKERCVKAIGEDNMYFTISASVKNCTGCGLCYQTCPGMKGNKALKMDTLDSFEQEVFDYLSKNVKEKQKDNKTIKSSQFKEPNFKYCGACAGCGEATYIKLLTQIVGDNLVVANATGCSSIYGGSAPSNPYTIPWASSLFEDNAEYGYGMNVGINIIRNRIKTIMENNMDNPNKELFTKWINNYDDYEITKEVYDSLSEDIPEELKPLKPYIKKRSIWCIGGDGWAYDIGFGGLDHVLSRGEDINVLVLDTEMYSNTGGQASKSSPIGSLELFAASGKKTNKKDLARMLLTYKDVYVATISLGANMMQTLKVLKEANEYKGPSIVIAYSPCISHGIKGGMTNSLDMEKKAVECGYFPLFRRDPINGFTLDSKNVDFSKYFDFLELQTRYSSLKKVNETSQELLEENKKYAEERYEYLKNL